MTTGDDSGTAEASAPLKTLVSKPQSCESSDTNQASASSVPDMSGPDDFLANEAAKRRYLLRRFWRSAIDFWSRKGDRMAWSLSAAVLGLILINLGFQYGVNVWNRVIFDALEKHDSSTVFWLSTIFLPLAAASVCCGVANVYGRMTI